MLHKTLTLAALLVASGIVSIASTSPAEAGRKGCYYLARDTFSNAKVADGYAKAFSQSTACSRARNRCERELKRKTKQGKVGRGVNCIYISNVN